MHAVAVVPLAMLIGDSLTGGLTANPIQALTARTGTAALVCLILSLAVTPFSGVGGQAWVVPWRRPLGLYAFFYASLHMATFVALDYGLDWYLIWDTVLEKRYIVAGSGATCVDVDPRVAEASWSPVAEVAPPGVPRGDPCGHPFPVAGQGRHPATRGVRRGSSGFACTSPAGSAQTPPFVVMRWGFPVPSPGTEVPRGRAYTRKLSGDRE